MVGSKIERVPLTLGYVGNIEVLSSPIAASPAVVPTYVRLIIYHLTPLTTVQYLQPKEPRNMQYHQAYTQAMFCVSRAIETFTLFARFHTIAAPVSAAKPSLNVSQITWQEPKTTNPSARS